jgi:hypothetical protein
MYMYTRQHLIVAYHTSNLDLHIFYIQPTFTKFPGLISKQTENINFPVLTETLLTTRARFILLREKKCKT